MKFKFFGVFFLLVFLAGCVQQPPYTQQQAIQTSGQGRAVFSLTDAAADMGAVSKVEITVDSVQAHSAIEGWVTVSSNPRTYDLLALKASGNTALLADVNLKSSTYEQVRLEISKVLVTDAKGQHEAKLPSGELKIVGVFDVKTNSTSSIKFDFLADESLHLTGNGQYILAPVVHLETKEDAEVDVDAESKVEVKSGKIKTSVKVGMDEDGNVGVGLAIGKDKEISIENGKVKVGLKLGLGALSKTEENSNSSLKAKSEVKVSYGY